MHPRTFSGNDLRGKIDASNLSGTAATCGRSDRSNLQLGAAELHDVAKTEAGTEAKASVCLRCDTRRGLPSHERDNLKYMDSPWDFSRGTELCCI